MLLQGPNVMLGYLNRPEANAETLITDKDGVWLKTGDIAYVDPEGYYYVTGKQSEAICSANSSTLTSSLLPLPPPLLLPLPSPPKKGSRS